MQDLVTSLFSGAVLDNHIIVNVIVSEATEIAL
jgi:hypothetical protein